MEIKAKLTHPYTEQQRIDFIIQQNYNNGYEIRTVEHEEEAEEKVLEWDTIEVEQQKVDSETNELMYDENNNPIMETITKQVPHMTEETYIDLETGEEKTRQIQAFHMEQVIKTVIDYEAWGYTAEEIAAQKEAQRNAMTLTPADVERALYKAESMNFDDLLAKIEETMTGIDMKALKIEFKASKFYRGAKFGAGNLFDTIGNMLGYNVPEDMDYLFIHKELPAKVEPTEELTEEPAVEETEE